MEFIVNKHMNERIRIKLPLSNVYNVLGYNDIPSNKWLHTCMEILHLTQNTCTMIMYNDNYIYTYVHVHCVHHSICSMFLTEMYMYMYMKLMYNTPFYILHCIPVQHCTCTCTCTTSTCTCIYQYITY